VTALGVRGEPLAVGQVVDMIAGQLGESRIANASAEARDIVAAVLDENRFWPRVHAETVISRELADRAFAVAALRRSGMPFAYAVGRAAFRHLTLQVTERVLIPRQETEVLIDLVLERRRTGTCADIGTGSGAIALALAAEGSFERIVATDIDAGAVALARHNAEALGPQLRAPVFFRTGNLLAPLAGDSFDLLVSNPPYIAFEEAVELPASVRNWEPGHALYSGSHGLDATRRIIADAPGILSTGGLLALEVDSRRATTVADLAASSGHFRDVGVFQDLAGRDRFVLATRAA
jgi:release factor glutamine methyltransferase